MNILVMFTKKELACFVFSFLLVGSAYLLMALDPTPYGFGIMTLWIAPPLLLAGLGLPVAAIVGISNESYWSNFTKVYRSNPARFIGGGIVFLTSLVTYTVTLEPTASLWDPSEYIATAYKLQVPHSPGSPLFLLFARLFSMAAMNDISKVAPSINMMSACFSALTVFIVYHLTYFFGERALSKSDRDASVMLTLAAACGSLCLAFSDSFWFSAVEAENYAAAAFFLMLLIWLIVTGNQLEEHSRQRRLMLIFYLAGLSYGVHPMCLLALSVLPFYWTTRDHDSSVTKFIFTIAFGLLLVVGINRLVAVGFFELLFSFDLVFVNTLKLPFYTGAICAIVLSALTLFFAVCRWKKYIHLSLSVAFLLLGFVPYLMLFIRSNHNPPIDETNPEDLALIKAYMNRESYGSVPLLYGPYFDAEVESVAIKNKMYYRDSNEYKVAGTTSEYRFDRRRQTILPRMYSNDPNNITVYRQWTDLNASETPTFLDNLEFMFRFQLGEMYSRYLLFNFAGRESDVQYATWLKPWDRFQGEHPNKARNQYWMIPLIAGAVGFFFQWRTNKKDTIAISIFFLVTGALLAFYLNSPPNEPRERDYIYVGSFIAYSVWIGLGALSIVSKVSQRKPALYCVAALFMLIPTWMAIENFDDHDRSGRTFQIDNARNLLQSCAPNSILFTGGDNDTFPLWYLQEVENCRTDVRIMVLSYLNTDWYINQLRRDYYKSPAFKLSLNEKDYLQYGPNDVVYLDESIKAPIEAKKYLQLLHEEHEALRRYSSNGEPYSILPSRSLIIPASHSGGDGFRTGTSHPEIDMVLPLTGNFLPKNALAILDLMVSNEWRRPIYFNFSSYNQLDLDLKPYLRQEGLVYRITPVGNATKDVEPDIELMYRNLITNASYENLMRDDIYFNHEDYQLRMIEPLRSAFNVLAVSLINDRKDAEAGVVLDAALEHLYGNHLNPSFSNLQMSDILLALGRKEEARRLTTLVFDSAFADVKNDLARNGAAGQLSMFLLKRSTELLARSGAVEYTHKVKELGISFP